MKGVAGKCIWGNPECSSVERAPRVRIRSLVLFASHWIERTSHTPWLECESVDVMVGSILADGFRRQGRANTAYVSVLLSCRLRACLGVALLQRDAIEDPAALVRRFGNAEHALLATSRSVHRERVMVRACVHPQATSARFFPVR